MKKGKKEYDKFRPEAIKKVEEYLRTEDIAAKISTISEVYEMPCEWCDNKSKAVTFGFKTLGPEFDKGFCCNGSMTVFEDESFGPQSDWFVCNRCDHD